jgi:hypothetical protein
MKRNLSVKTYFQSRSEWFDVDLSPDMMKYQSLSITGAFFRSLKYFCQISTHTSSSICRHVFIQAVNWTHLQFWPLKIRLQKGNRESDPLCWGWGKLINRRLGKINMKDNRYLWQLLNFKGPSAMVGVEIGGLTECHMPTYLNHNHTFQSSLIQKWQNRQSKVKNWCWIIFSSVSYSDWSGKPWKSKHTTNRKWIKHAYTRHGIITWQNIWIQI